MIGRGQQVGGRYPGRPHQPLPQAGAPARRSQRRDRARRPHRRLRRPAPRPPAHLDLRPGIRARAPRRDRPIRSSCPLRTSRRPNGSAERNVPETCGPHERASEAGGRSGRRSYWERGSVPPCRAGSSCPLAENKQHLLSRPSAEERVRRIRANSEWTNIGRFTSSQVQVTWSSLLPATPAMTTRASCLSALGPIQCWRRGGTPGDEALGHASDVHRRPTNRERSGWRVRCFGKCIAALRLVAWRRAGRFIGSSPTAPESWEWS
jgi:hypothetical protein